MDINIRKLLLSGGLISPADLEAAEGAAAKLNRPEIQAEHILIRQGKVTLQQIAELVGGAVKTACIDAMTQPYGLYIFKPAQEAAPKRVLCRLPFVEIALGYARRTDNPPDILQRFLTDTHIPRLGDQFEEIRSKGHLRFLPNEWKILFRVDGRRNIRQIREALQLPEAEFDRCLFACLITGALNAKNPEPERAIHTAATQPIIIAPESAPAETAAPAAQSAEPPTEVQRKKSFRRVLIVDDSRTVQRMVQMALEELEYDMETADDGYEAIRRAECQIPDLVILDVIMPGLDGYKTCSRLRKIFSPAKIPIIMLSAKDGTFNAIRGKLAGATNYLTKPFEPAELRRVVQSHLGTEPQRA